MTTVYMARHFSFYLIEDYTPLDMTICIFILNHLNETSHICSLKQSFSLYL